MMTGSDTGIYFHTVEEIGKFELFSAMLPEGKYAMPKCISNDYLLLLFFIT